MIGTTISGKCVEGLDVEACPHFKTEPENDAETSVVAVPEITIDSSAVPRLPDPDSISLNQSERMPIGDTSIFLKQGNGKVLAIVGPSDSGKTSLIGALYTLFLNGPINDVHFAGSKTMLAFEQACHDLRAISGRHEPLMKHTEYTSSPMGINFYHLAVQKPIGSSTTHLLLGDRTGEDYTNAPDDPATTKDFVEVQRADKLIVLVNGEGLLEPSTRETTKARASHILKVFVDSGITNASQSVLLILTKMDALKTAGDTKCIKVEQIFDKLCSDIQLKHHSDFAEIGALKIAASPKSKILPFGYGIEKILDFWMNEIPHVPETEYKQQFDSDRAIGRFQSEG
jgi:energy-coupling factor transporter ATP-binding protein EcfA2